MKKAVLLGLLLILCGVAFNLGVNIEHQKIEKEKMACIPN